MTPEEQQRIVEAAINSSPTIKGWKAKVESNEHSIARKLDQIDNVAALALRDHLAPTSGHVFDKRATLNFLAEVYRQSLERLDKDALASVLASYMAAAALSKHI